MSKYFDDLELTEVGTIVIKGKNNEIPKKDNTNYSIVSNNAQNSDTTINLNNYHNKRIGYRARKKNNHKINRNDSRDQVKPIKSQRYKLTVVGKNRRRTINKAITKKSSFWRRLELSIRYKNQEYEFLEYELEHGLLSEKEKSERWQEIKDYQEAKQDKGMRRGLATLKVGLVLMELAAFIGGANYITNKVYNEAHQTVSHFWDNTNLKIDKKNFEYEELYGDYYPSGEKKEKITHQEWETLPGESKNNIKEPPIDNINNKEISNEERE